MADKEYLRMPEETHGTGRLAADQVSTIFHKNNCAVERVAADYGEDLLIQPSRNEQVEHFKIWVQVKGTSDIEKYRQPTTNEIVRYVSFAHMFKWLRSKELCVLVLWDVNKEYGLFFLPREEVGEWEFYTDRPESVRVAFDEGKVLHKDSIQNVIWRARYEHYAMLVSHARARLEYALDEEHKKHAQALEWSVEMDFFKQVNIIVRVVHDDGDYELRLCERFRNAMIAAFNKISTEQPGTDHYLIVGQAVGLALLGRLEELTGQFGFPPELFEPCIPTLIGMAQSLRQAESCGCTSPICLCMKP